MIERSEIYVGGAWRPSAGEGHFDVVHAATEEVMGRVPAGTAADVDAAAEAAAAAFEAWSTQSPAARGEHLARIAAGLAARTDELAAIIAGEVGMPLPMAKRVQVGLPTMVMKSYAALAGEGPAEDRIGNSLVVREPVGVVGCITPWNYPLHQLVAKVAPALAAGCTVVAKPSEVAPLSAFILADVIHEAGLPAGVFNLVSGAGVPVGEAIATHPKVDKVSFTGSTRAGKRVAALAAETIKRVSLELGGKSASVILDDADLALAVKRSMSQALLNSGQTCSAWTRLLVPEGKMDEAIEVAKAVAAKFAPGDPMEGKARIGPLASAAQRDRVRSYIQKGIDEGAELVCGGADAPEGLDRGFYVAPTVFARVDNAMTIAQEEIFGPVLCLIGYADEDEAVRIANDSPYGLGGGVWSADEDRAKRVARRLRTGQVDINGGSYNPHAPFGGYKMSGYGREYGPLGLNAYLEIKSLQL